METIKVNNISKSYGTVQALKNISFAVGKGELFGVIGPDGAGKTTLFRILATLLYPDGGEAWMNGLDVVKDFKTIRKQIGYMPGRFSLYQDLSVEENLNFFATIFGTTIQENYGLVKDIYTQIEPFKTRQAGKLSGGMKQKLALSCAMIHKPDILVLDEPTTGVDAVSRKEFWEMLIRLKEKGITIIVSTPYMDEASLCDRVVLIQKGSILDIDTPANIMHGFGKPLLALKSDNIYRLIADVRAFHKTATVYPFGEYLHYTSLKGDINEDELRSYLQERSHVNLELKRIGPNIEDCFMELMIKKEDDGE